MKLIAGNSNPELAARVAKHLGVELCRSELKTFSDREISVRIDENVRGEDVFVIQSTCTPANDHLMELLICVDALKRASPQRITAVLPYFGYARQDRKATGRTAISAKLVADMLDKAGVHRVLTMDLHAGQIVGFFNIPVDNLMGMHTLADDIHRHRPKNPLVISPDAGGVVRARMLASKLQCGLAIVDKRREKANESEVMHIIGDVKGYDCIIIDDMVDTAGTLVHGAEALLQAGATSVAAYVTHGVLSGPAYERIAQSPLTELVVTDTIPLAAHAQKIRQVSVAPVIGEAIRRVHYEESVSRLNE